MKSLIKKIIMSLYCYRLISFKITAKIVSKLKGD